MPMSVGYSGLVEDSSEAQTLAGKESRKDKESGKELHRRVIGERNDSG